VATVRVHVADLDHRIYAFDFRNGEQAQVVADSAEPTEEK
jgi:hypothetical protein